MFVLRDASCFSFPSLLLPLLVSLNTDLPPASFPPVSFPQVFSLRPFPRSFYIYPQPSARELETFTLSSPPPLNLRPSDLVAPATFLPSTSARSP